MTSVSHAKHRQIREICEIRVRKKRQCEIRVNKKYSLFVRFVFKKTQICGLYWLNTRLLFLNMRFAVGPLTEGK